MSIIELLQSTDFCKDKNILVASKQKVSVSFKYLQFRLLYLTRLKTQFQGFCFNLV